jgi:Zn-dependent protease/CBS domain-containing protein
VRVTGGVIQPVAQERCMFGKPIPLFTVFGFQIKLDWSWFIIAVLLAGSLRFGFPRMQPEAEFSGIVLWAMGILGALAFFVSIVAHELGHAVVAERQGVPMRGITLFIFGGVAEMTAEPPSAKAEFLVAIGGPVVSLVLGLALLAATAIPMPLPLLAVVGWLGVINLVLLVFNLIPAFPLDGGRVLRSILWQAKNDMERATWISAQVGGGFGIALILLGVFTFIAGNFLGGVWLGLVGLFLRTAAMGNYQQVVMRGALEGKPIGAFVNDQPQTIRPGATIEDFVESYVYRYHHKMFPVVDDGQLLGWITVDAIRDLPRARWQQHSAGEFMTRPNDENSVDADTDAMQVLQQMSQVGQSRLLVMRDGELVGIITMKDLMQYIDLHRELEMRPS